MVEILSIDFDYFIDVSSKERDIYFPNGFDEIPEEKLKTLWEERYMKYPKLKKIGVIKEYNNLKNFLMSLHILRENIYMADSHKYIKILLDKIPKQKQIMIANIDFHHDYYHYYIGNDPYNCGNWLRRLMEERPDTKAKWIQRKDSQIYSLEGEVPFEHTCDVKSIFNKKYDYVFICKSPEWTPPHLSNKYEELASALVRAKEILKVM